LLESSLPKRIDAIGASPTSKLPFKVLLYRETLIWRMAELSRASFQSFERDGLVSAIVLARAAVETSAALWSLCAKVADAVESDAINEIDEYLMKLVAGMATGAPETDTSTNDVTLPRPVKVGAFLNQVEKDIKGFSHQYGVLSEYAHPNWAGTVLLYAKHDAENQFTDFGQNLRKEESTKRIGACNLTVALAIFENAYNRVTDLIPTFTRLCERCLKESQDKAGGLT
jgi:hypothetical protein